MKRLIILIVVIAIIFAVWALFFRGPLGYDEFRAVENKYKQPDELVPSTLENINGYKQDMLFLKSKYSGSQDAVLLADIKIDLAEIEENLIVLGNEFSKIDRRNPDCSAGSSISKAQKLLDASGKKMAEVNKNIQKLEAGYKGFADASGVSGEQFKQSVAGISSSMENIGSIINSFC
jgi:hypothetical protein